jgi:hypothetical protein
MKFRFWQEWFRFGMQTCPTEFVVPLDVMVEKSKAHIMVEVRITTARRCHRKSSSKEDPPQIVKILLRKL